MPDRRDRTGSSCTSGFGRPFSWLFKTGRSNDDIWAVVEREGGAAGRGGASAAGLPACSLTVRLVRLLMSLEEAMDRLQLEARAVNSLAGKIINVKAKVAVASEKEEVEVHTVCWLPASSRTAHSHFPPTRPV